MTKIMLQPNLIKQLPNERSIALPKIERMKTNMGNTDKVIRILVAVVILVLYFTNQISGTLAIVGLVLSVVFMLTSLIGVCPLYLPFGISTKQKE